MCSKMFMMCMSSDHNLMQTADAVFLRNAADETKTVAIKIDGEDTDMSVKLSLRLQPLMPDVSIQGEYFTKVRTVQMERDARCADSEAYSCCLHHCMCCVGANIWAS